MASEEDQTGVAVADQVEERIVGGDGLLRLGRPRLGETQSGGCLGRCAPLVDSDVRGVDRGIELCVRADPRIATRCGADIDELCVEVELSVVFPRRQ